MYSYGVMKWILTPLLALELDIILSRHPFSDVHHHHQLFFGRRASAPMKPSFDSLSLHSRRHFGRFNVLAILVRRRRHLDGRAPTWQGNCVMKSSFTPFYPTHVGSRTLLLSLSAETRRTTGICARAEHVERL